MNGYFYNKILGPCHPDDKHIFARMVKGVGIGELQVRVVQPGDLIKLQEKIILGWKIVKDKDEKLYLGLITKHTYFYSQRNQIYVVAPGKDPTNPYLALYKVKNRSNVTELVKLFK